jgi:hypothetical protein
MEKKQTLEEAAKEYAQGKSSADVFREAHIRDFIQGAKWQDADKNSITPREIKINGSCGTTFDVVAPIELPTAIKKQTALDWYIEQNFNNIVQRETQQISQDEYVIAYNNLLNQAKQMEKEQIEDAFVIRPYTNFEKYYNETFGETKN